MSAQVNSVPLDELNVVLTRKNMKRAHIKIESDLSVHVSVPSSWSDKAVQTLLNSSSQWISTQRSKILSKQTTYTLANNEIFYRGSVWQNVVVPVLGSHINVEPAENRIYSGASLYGAALTAWYKAEAKFHLPARLRTLAIAHGYNYKRCVIRQTERKWGSWRSDGLISLNSKLILVPESVSDAIILHELVHSVQPNHSKHFWQALYAICPSWDEADAWLKSHQYFMSLIF
jgi:predicted metal-dependent hydrolase